MIGEELDMVGLDQGRTAFLLVPEYGKLHGWDGDEVIAVQAAAIVRPGVVLAQCEEGPYMLPVTPDKFMRCQRTIRYRAVAVDVPPCKQGFP